MEHGAVTAAALKWLELQLKKEGAKGQFLAFHSGWIILEGDVSLLVEIF